MMRVGIVGGRGYVGEELIQILLQHEKSEIVFVGSTSQAGELVADHSDQIEDRVLRFDAMDLARMREQEVDVWVLAQANGQAAQWVADLDNGRAKFLDISADFRFDQDWVYGLPEWNRQRIKGAARVANPGCYATAAQFALNPLKPYLLPTPTVFGISGFSGAGKTPSDKNDPRRLHNNILPYRLTDHMHEREVSQQLEMPIDFMPHVAAFFRGITVTINAHLDRVVDLQERFEKCYSGNELVEVQSSIPEVADVRGTPRCIVGGFEFIADTKRAVIVSVIDNLLKGAASQAVQNLNLMFELPENTGLLP